MIQASTRRNCRRLPKSTSSLGFFDFQGPNVSQEGAAFDDQDCQDRVNIIAAASIARCMANVADSFGFHDSVDKGKAEELSKKTIAQLITAMYGDHVNGHLKVKGMPSLQKLREEPGFFDSFHKLLLSSPFDHNALSRNVGRNYTMALLYCYEYLKHGPAFDITTELSAESKDTNHWAAIFHSWMSQSQDNEFKKANPDFKIEDLLRSVGAVLALQGYPDATTREVAQHLKERVIGDMVRWEIAQDISQFEILGQNIWAAWDSATTDYQDAVTQAVNNRREEHGPAFSAYGSPSYQRTTYYGEKADQFMCAFMGTGLFKSRAGNRIQSGWVTAPVIPGCFRQGTQVIVGSGSKNIEELREGDDVLTRGGDSPQWGECSDEAVVQPCVSGENRCRLYGFNGQQPFTSVSHVFHTTTGLRAIDPAGARKENPWLKVGRLRIGHQLIWTKDGSRYTPVTINTIESEEADCTHIYGVHLREGLRSYHANGYLVHLNYPEITAQSISSALSCLSPSDQMAILRNFKELQPLFERFGGVTLMEALRKQMQHPYTQKTPLVPSRLPAHALRKHTGVEQLRRQWALQEDGQQAWDGGKWVPLPTLSTFEGVVSVDGEYCMRAHLEDNIVAWSRKISDFGWEHGFLRLDSSSMMGQGRIFYSSDLDIFDERNVRNIIGYPTTQTLPEALIDKNKVTDPVAQSLLAGGHGTGWAAAPMTIMPRMMLAASLPSSRPAVQLAKGEEYQCTDTYAVSYETSEWSDTDESVKKPAKYCDVVTAMHVESRVSSKS